MNNTSQFLSEAGPALMFVVPFIITIGFFSWLTRPSEPRVFHAPPPPPKLEDVVRDAVLKEMSKRHGTYPFKFDFDFWPDTPTVKFPDSPPFKTDFEMKSVTNVTGSTVRRIIRTKRWENGELVEDREEEIIEEDVKKDET